MINKRQGTSNGRASRGMDIRDQYQVLHEFIPAAKHALTPDKWDYMIGAAETETTLKRNRLALNSIGFRPRVLRDVSAVDCSGKLFGRRHRIPVMLAPVGSIERFDAGGAATVARAAARFRRAANGEFRLHARS